MYQIGPSDGHRFIVALDFSRGVVVAVVVVIVILVVPQTAISLGFSSFAKGFVKCNPGFSLVVR